MSTKTNMSQMFIRVVKPVVSRAPVRPASVTRSLPTPILRTRGRTPIMSLSNIMTHNSTPCRSCGH
jgi:hypothetical protein